MDYNEYYEVLKYCESILKKKTSEIRGLEVRALEKSPRFAEDSEYHSGLGTAIEYMRMMIEEVKNAESRAAAAERERDELKALLSRVQEDMGWIETIYVKEDLEIGPIYDFEGSIMEKATNAIYQELIPRLNEFVECRVQPDYSRMGTPVICAKLSLVRSERKRDDV